MAGMTSEEVLADAAVDGITYLWHPDDDENERDTSLHYLFHLIDLGVLDWQ